MMHAYKHILVFRHWHSWLSNSLVNQLAMLIWPPHPDYWSYAVLVFTFVDRELHWSVFCSRSISGIVQSDTKKRELLKTPTKIEEIQEKKIYW